MNAQVKIILACAFSIGVFFIDSWAGMAVIAGCLVALYAVARVPLTRAFRGVGPVALILVFTVLVHAWGLSLEGLGEGLFVASRIAVLIFACMLLTFTTAPMELTDGLLRIIWPLRKLRVPVDDLALVISLALRFVPVTAQEAYVVRDAQMARCGDFESGSVLARAKAWGPVLVPLFVRLFRRAGDLAQAMDARCYHSGTRRPACGKALSMPSLATLAVGLAALIALCLLL